VSFDFTIDSAYRSKVLQISFEYAVAAGTFAAGSASADSDITVWIYDKTNAVMIQPVTYKLFANGALSTTFNSYFQANPNSTSYRLILHSATSSALAYDLKVDMVSVNPQIVTTGNVRGPVGSIIATGSLTPPMGYLYADGSAVSRTNYAYLFQAIGTTFGVGDGSTTFNLPDLRGIFARGAGTQTFGSITYSATLGTKQNDQMQGHIHQYLGVNSTGTGSSSLVVQTTQNGPFTGGISTPASDGTNGTPRTGSETRPANQAVAYHVCFDSGSVQMSDSIDYDRAEIGTVHAYAGLTAPTGFLLCDGTAVSRSLYSDLYAVIGTTYGVGDGSTTFNLPDTRGIFLRGAGTNPSNGSNTTTIGTRQLDDFKSHTHAINTWNGNTSAATNIFGTQSAVFQGTTNTGGAGGTETRPANVGVNYIIRHAKRVVPSSIAATETIAAFGQTTAGLSIPNNAWTPVTTPTIVDSTHGALTTGGVFTAPAPGRYAVSVTAFFGTNGTGSRGVRVRKNSGDTGLGNFTPAGSTASTGATVSGYLRLNAGDTMTMEAFQNSGGAVSLGTTPDVASTFSIVRVGN
jgi:microcystin-dependent protein